MNNINQKINYINEKLEQFKQEQLSNLSKEEQEDFLNDWNKDESIDDIINDINNIDDELNKLKYDELKNMSKEEQEKRIKQWNSIDMDDYLNEIDAKIEQLQNDTNN